MALPLFIQLLLEEDRDRNEMRLERRFLRDAYNPFELPPQEFIRQFRLNREAVLDLCEEIRPYITETNILLETKILCAMNFYAGGSFQNPVGWNVWISLSQPSVSRCICQVSEAISTHLLRRYIKYPTTFEDKQSIKTCFYRKHGLRGIIGAIDGTHVELLAPPLTDADHPPHVYINRKGKHSVNVMLIVDSNAKIIGCSARYPGSVHDAAIWQMSTIRTYLEERFEDGERSSYLLGDSGYPLEPWLLTPLLNPRNEREENYNRLHKATRNVVERANGILKGRFRCLSRFRTLMYHPIKAAHIINSCCVLHNIALARNIQLNNEEIEVEIYDNQDLAQPAAHIQNNNNNYFLQARQIRDMYIANM